ncbi:MAG: hypothetical protein H7067_04605 [Burkholderiales bacterium]|nr:hypothetical protein [Opitutaceae bacterium]
MLASFGAIAALAGGEAKAEGVDIIRGNQMNLGVPPSSRFTDGPRAVFFSAPVPSGWSLMLVLSSNTTFSSSCTNPSC